MTVTLVSGQPGNAQALSDRGKYEVKALSTASTAVTLSTADSGKLLLVGQYTTSSGGGGGPTITLPVMADGMCYELYVTAGLASGTISIASATSDTIVGFNDAALDSINIGKATGAPTIGASIRFCSDGTKWYSAMQPAFTSAAPTTTATTVTQFGLVS